MSENETQDQDRIVSGEIQLDPDPIEVPDHIVERWQGIVDSLAEATEAPAALIMKLNRPYIEVFRSSDTGENPYQVGDRERLEGLFCQEVIESGERLLVENASQGEKWASSPDLELGMISYLGYPLNWPSGEPFGTICVLDREERSYDKESRRLLQQLRELVEAHLALIYQNKYLKRLEQETELEHERLVEAMETGKLAWWEMELPSGKVNFGERKAEMLGYSPERFEGYSDFTELIHREDHGKAMRAMRDHLEGKRDKYEVEYRIKTENGSYKWFRDVGGITEKGQGSPYKRVTGISMDIDDRKKAQIALQEERKKLKRLHQAVDKLQRRNDEGAVLTTAIDVAENILGFEICVIGLLENDRLVVKALSKCVKTEETIAFRIGEGVAGKTVQKKETIWGNVSDHPEAKPVTDKFKSFISVPIGEMGNFQVVSTKEDNFEKRDVDLAEILANHLREELKRVRLEKELRQKADSIRSTKDKLEFLHEVAGKLESAKKSEEIYQLAVEAAEGALDFLFCSLGIVEGDSIVTKATSSGLPPGGTRTMKTGEGLSGKTYREGKTYVYGDIREVEEAEPVRPEYRSFISAPIGDVGVFQVVSAEIDAFSEEDARLVELLAGHVFEALRRVELEEELKERAIRDPLTGLYNRRYFNETLQKEVKRSKRYNEPLAFLMIDVNRFKEINDRYSHQTGDEVLQEVGGLLRENVRSADTVVRYGGDEFLVMMPETNGEAKIVVSRLKEQLKLWNRQSDLLDFPLTLAMGISHWDPKQDEDIEKVLKKSDKMMYRDKIEKDSN